MTINCRPPEGATRTQVRIFADHWHPSTGLEETAKRLCDGCPGRERCLEDALTRPDPHTGAWPTGIFGGTTTRERAKLRDQRQQVSA